ncbi:acyltransferase family protein [Mycolicibacterium psychrotolerans]|uniref:acyltransferase family protein n=1 Tax=Mycolicibacterium psychrotolerans TaxID=216929 RepID=UPI003D669E60
MSLFLINPGVQFPAPWAALPVLSTAVVVAAFSGAEVPAVMSPLTNRVAQWFGDTSYTLYLWHWPVIVLLLTLFPKGPAFYGIAIVVSLALTAVTYHFYENPLRNSQKWMLRDKPVWASAEVSAAVGGLAAAAVVVAIVGYGVADKRTATYQETARPSGAVADLSPTKKIDPCFGAAAIITQGCSLRSPGAELSPDIDSFAKDTPPLAADCYRPKTGTEMKPCSFGYEGPDAVQIALVGDSHARALLPALWPLLDRNKWHLTTYLGVDCVLADQPDGCNWLMPKVEAELVAHRYNLVIATSLNRGTAISPQEYERAWAPIMAAGSRIAAVVDNPIASEESLACLTRVSFDADHTGDCGTPRIEALPRMDALATAAKATPGVTLIDLTQFYCTPDRCPSVIGNVIVYSDASDSLRNSHPTATFTQTLAPPLESALKPVLAAR